MGNITPDNIRNIAFVGHVGCGKTTLAEALLFKMGATPRWCKPADGASVLDYEPEEKERGGTVDSAMGSGTWKGAHVNIVDTPGATDFIGATVGALCAVETAVVVIAANQGIGVGTRKVWTHAAKRAQPRVVVVTKPETENVDLQALFATIKGVFGPACTPFVAPMGQSSAFQGAISILDPDPSAPEDVRAQAESQSENLRSAIYEADDELVERYLEGEDISREETQEAIRKALVAGTLCPVFITSMEKETGYEELLDFIVQSCPSPKDLCLEQLHGDDDEPQAMSADPGAPLVARVFKTLVDPIIGKINYLRIFQGSLAKDTAFADPNAGRAGKLTAPSRPLGKDRADIASAGPGEIVAVTKVETLSCGDTVKAPGVAGSLPPMPMPKPMVSLAVQPVSQKDVQKIGEALRKLSDGDPTFVVSRDQQSNELTCSGVTEMHLKYKLECMAKQFKVNCTTKPPRVPYKETITGSADVRHRHKKQSGGSGEFAEVAIKISPAPRDSETPLTFKNDIFGGAISQNFIPSVEKGIRSRMTQGVMAGYPVVDVEVSLYDGKEHPVDSKDVAFQKAGRAAFRDAFMQARPCLLEPVVDAVITVPTRCMGDVAGDLSSVRRGRVQGMDSLGDLQIISAQVPLAEMLNYASSLRAMTQGEGDYSIEFSHYDIVPKQLETKIIGSFKAHEDDD